MGYISDAARNRTHNLFRLKREPIPLYHSDGHRCHRWVYKRCSGIAGKLKSNVDFHCRRCVEGENGLFQSVLVKEIVIEPNVKLECVPKFCYLGDTLGAGGGADEAARARVRCAWAKFKELSPILTAHGASYHIKGKIFRACVQSVLTYGTETWAMKAENLQSLGRAERMMVRWMCGVSLKDRKRSEVLYGLLGVQSVAEVVRRGRLRWFGMWNVRMRMIGCRLVEMWWWRG